ncbi:thioredoxin [Oleiagrimonas sp. C23AA]|uniref:thioredoxin n=1 Tax=Oleiagrimonas sp. C23AA TaxID=2719047 RepID=UPI0014200C16|nr:thioredoxin [Oleiagrimonas sp. C23AA]
MTVANTHVFDVTQGTFETDVIKASLETPILVDFWAEWCGPCKSLGPLLEKLAGEYNGSFRLAKVDVEAEQELAGIFGVRSIPTVVLIKDGQIADGFAGALPESQLREFLSRHVQPSSRLEGVPEEATSEPETATETPDQALARIQQEMAAAPDKPELKLDLAQALIHTGQYAAAEAELANLPANLATDDRAKRLQGQLELARSLEQAPDETALRQRIDLKPDDWEARELLGVRLVLGHDPGAGLEQFLAILKEARDWNDGQARKRLLAAFQILDDAALVGRYRRQMSSLLF